MVLFFLQLGFRSIMIVKFLYQKFWLRVLCDSRPQKVSIVASYKYFTKYGFILGVRCRVSGVRKIQMAEHRKQMTEDKRKTVFCPQSFVC